MDSQSNESSNADSITILLSKPLDTLRCFIQIFILAIRRGAFIFSTRIRSRVVIQTSLVSLFHNTHILHTAKFVHTSAKDPVEAPFCCICHFLPLFCDFHTEKMLNSQRTLCLKSRPSTSLTPHEFSSRIKTIKSTITKIIKSISDLKFSIGISNVKDHHCLQPPQNNNITNHSPSFNSLTLTLCFSFLIIHFPFFCCLIPKSLNLLFFFFSLFFLSTKLLQSTSKINSCCHLASFYILVRYCVVCLLSLSYLFFFISLMIFFFFSLVLFLAINRFNFSKKQNLLNCLQLKYSMLHSNSTLCTVTVHQSLFESFWEKVGSNIKSFVGISPCQLPEFEQVIFVDIMFLNAIRINNNVLMTDKTNVYEYCFCLVLCKRKLWKLWCHFLFGGNGLPFAMNLKGSFPFPFLVLFSFFSFNCSFFCFREYNFFDLKWNISNLKIDSCVSSLLSFICGISRISSSSSYHDYNHLPCSSRTVPKLTLEPQPPVPTPAPNCRPGNAMTFPGNYINLPAMPSIFQAFLGNECHGFSRLCPGFCKTIFGTHPHTITLNHFRNKILYLRDEFNPGIQLCCSSNWAFAVRLDLNLCVVWASQNKNFHLIMFCFQFCISLFLPQKPTMLIVKLILILFFLLVFVTTISYIIMKQSTFLLLALLFYIHYYFLYQFSTNLHIYKSFLLSRSYLQNLCEIWSIRPAVHPRANPCHPTLPVVPSSRLCATAPSSAPAKTSICGLRRALHAGLPALDSAVPSKNACNPSNSLSCLTACKDPDNLTSVLCWRQNSRRVPLGLQVRSNAEPSIWSIFGINLQ
ncbi:hypothetical protein VP01_265g4 [Puccinia sorghi]|uniref:Uncharacterized protein n=1 Tax=Puccinia sorghi TaxID=27349 RepID=A0A0L6V4Q7_9BASI|nr:hypothetical protein VP01_265g4 [Puccinia sorghi]